MTTTTSIHSGATPPARPAPQTIGTGVRGFQVLPREQTRPGAAPAGSAGRPPGRGSSEWERPEDDEEVITAVLAAVSHRSSRERPEDDEVVLTYTSEPACRHLG